MRLWKKTLAATALAPVVALVGCLAYFWATYLDEKVTSGTAYGFSVGASKPESLTSASQLRNYPDAVVYVSYGPGAGEHFTVDPKASQIGQLQQHDQWDVLLDGNGKFFNLVRLTFRNGQLAEIYRHRQRFELP